jgi:hypothetical protein
MFLNSVFGFTSWLLAKRQEPRAKDESSSLALFVFRVDADHAHHAFAVDDLALVTDFLY